jgi:hypothetical protein
MDVVWNRAVMLLREFYSLHPDAFQYIFLMLQACILDIATADVRALVTLKKRI